MEVASQAAIGGSVELETAVDGITSTVNAFAASGITAREVSDQMFTAVRTGGTTFGELSDSLFQVSPVAADLGVKFGDVAAALAQITSKGVPTSVATTQLRATLSLNCRKMVGKLLTRSKNYQVRHLLISFIVVVMCPTLWS